MKFYYEHRDLPNGPLNWCKISEFDQLYGFKNKFFELTYDDEIVWCFTTNNRTQIGRAHV